MYKTLSRDPKTASIIKKKSLVNQSIAVSTDALDFSPIVGNKNSHNIKIGKGRNDSKLDLRISINDKKRGLVTQPSVLKIEMFLDDSDLQQILNPKVY